MCRALSALREWLQLRARLHGEHQFHLENAAAEFRSQGMSPGAADRTARVRFGNRRYLKIALRELGGDLPGLAYLLRVHRVFDSAWLQPALLLAAAALLLFLSPAPRSLVESLIATPLAAVDRDAVFLCGDGRSVNTRAISEKDYEVLGTLTSLRQVERYQVLYARAQVAPGATLAAIQSEARLKTGSRLWASSLFAQTRIVTGPAEVVWVLISFFIVFSLRRHVPARSAGRWLAYAFVVGILHAMASLMVWGVGVQIWTSSFVSGLVFGLLFLGYLLLTAVQCRYWWSDLNQRCPICFDRVLLPLTEGTTDRILLDSAITESVCAHGHGVLVESRWSHRFRPEESPLRGLVRA
jgi:hypothetical protein